MPVPKKTAPAFESGGTWRAFELGDEVLYVFRRPMGKGPPARGLLVDRKRRRGRLFLAPTEYISKTGFALSFPLDELLFQHHFAYRRSLVLHACGIAVASRAALFLGHSGAGKTTTARLWRRFAPDSLVLSDDRLVVRPHGRGFVAHGTPWHGSGRYAEATARPLRALFFLKQASITNVRRIDGPGLVSALFSLCFPPPWEESGLTAALATCERLVGRLPCYELRFRKDESAVAAAREILLDATRASSALNASR